MTVDLDPTERWSLTDPYGTVATLDNLKLKPLHGDTTLPPLDEEIPQVVTHEATDGTLVTTTFNSEGEPVEVIITKPNGTVLTYELVPLGPGLAWVTTMPDGTIREGLPDGEFSEETGGYRLEGLPAHVSGGVSGSYVLEDDPADDTAVVSVEATDVPPTEDLNRGEQDDYEAYIVTFADGTQVTVLVEKSGIPEGETGESVATLYGERISVLPPEVRAEIIDGGTSYLLSSETLASSAGVSTDLLLVQIDFLFDATDAYFDSIMLHETGHLVDDKVPEEWEAAVAADGVSPSEYGNTNIQEDYAETYMLWYLVRSGQITGSEAAELEEKFGNRFAILDGAADAVSSLPGAADGTLVTLQTLENGDVVETRRELQEDGSWETTVVRVTRESGLVVTFKKNDNTDDSSWEKTSVWPGEEPVTSEVPNVPENYYTDDTNATDIGGFYDDTPPILP